MSQSSSAQYEFYFRAGQDFGPPNHSSTLWPSGEPKISRLGELAELLVDFRSSERNGCQERPVFPMWPGHNGMEPNRAKICIYYRRDAPR